MWLRQHHELLAQLHKTEAEHRALHESRRMLQVELEACKKMLAEKDYELLKKRVNTRCAPRPAARRGCRGRLHVAAAPIPLAHTLNPLILTTTVESRACKSLSLLMAAAQALLLCL